MEIFKKALLKITPDFIYNMYRDKHYYKKYTNRYNRKINIYNKIHFKLKIDNPKKISVIIPNYNYKSYLKERIDSILFQTYPIYEIIILDDCSTDGSVTLIKEIIEKNKNVNIKLIENKKNSGSVFSQWQKGFENATGDFVWIAEADDSCNPKFLENVIKPFDDKDVVISYCESMRINQNNVIINTACRDWLFPISDTRWNKSYVKPGEIEIKETMSILNSIVNVSAVVFRNNDSKKIINILEKAKQFKMSGDWFTYYSILKSGKIAYTSKSLNYFRRHGNSTCSETTREIEIKELFIIQKDIRDNYELNSEQLYRQQIRYENIIDLISEESQKKYEKMMVKKIKWIINDLINIDTIMKVANLLVKNKYVCDLYFPCDIEVIIDKLKQINEPLFRNHLFGIYSIDNIQKEYDVSIVDNIIKTEKENIIFELQDKSIDEKTKELMNIVEKAINKRSK